MNHDQLLNKLYYEDLNFVGVNPLYDLAKRHDKTINKEFVSNWLKSQSTHQQTTKAIKKKEYKPIYSDDFYSYQIDLTFLNKYKNSNNGNYVLFTAININSRYAYAYYSKNKETSTILNLLDKFKNDAKEINKITADSGSEFTNKKVSDWFQDNNITLFFVIGDSHKLGIINRFHRTLKEKILKYFIASGTTRWIDVIDKIIKNYNNTENRTIGCTPTEASNHFIQSIIINNAQQKTEEMENKSIKYNIGDKCRIKENTKLFDKMKRKYSANIYTIVKVNKNTVDIENDELELNNIKKTDIIIIKESYNNKGVEHIKKVEKEHTIERKLKQEGVDESNIINSKRI